MYYLEGPIDLNVVDGIRNQRDRNQPSIIKILDQEVDSENKQDLEDRKLSIFLENIGELYDDYRTLYLGFSLLKQYLKRYKVMMKQEFVK